VKALNSKKGDTAFRQDSRYLPKSASQTEQNPDVTFAGMLHLPAYFIISNQNIQGNEVRRQDVEQFELLFADQITTNSFLKVERRW